MPQAYKTPPPEPGDLESPFLSPEMFAREEPESPFHLETFHAESPYVAGQFQFDIPDTQTFAPVEFKNCEKKVIALVAASPLVTYHWKPNRGKAPIGYLNGLALSYARAYSKYLQGDYFATLMAKEIVTNSKQVRKVDALAYLNGHFVRAGMTQTGAGKDVLRKCFVLLTGLGMLESSGKYYEGVDKTAPGSRSSRPDEEAGLFQVSYYLGVSSEKFPQIRNFYNYLKQLSFGGNLQVFAQGVPKTKRDVRDLDPSPVGQFRDFCLTKPGLVTELAALALRYRRKHWGPINRMEVELKSDTDKLLKDVQAIVDAETDHTCFLPDNWTPMPSQVTHGEFWADEVQSDWEEHEESTDEESEEADDELDHLSEDLEEDFSGIGFEDEDEELFSDPLSEQESRLSEQSDGGLYGLLEADRELTKSISGDQFGGRPLVLSLRTIDLQVAVFVPQSVLGRSSYELLLYVHGLISPCKPVPKEIPKDFITSPPFNLGRIIEESNRPMVLVVPHMEWKKGKPHNLGTPGILNSAIEELISEISKRLSDFPVTLSRFVIAGHSRAFGVLYPLIDSSSSIDMKNGALSKLTDIWMLDATYGTVPKSAIKALLESKPGLSVRIIFRRQSKTDKFNGKSLTGRLTLQPVPLSVRHCAVPNRCLPGLLATLPNFDVGSSREIDDEEYYGEEDKEEYELDWAEERTRPEEDNFAFFDFDAENFEDDLSAGVDEFNNYFDDQENDEVSTKANQLLKAQKQAAVDQALGRNDPEPKNADEPVRNADEGQREWEKRFEKFRREKKTWASWNERKAARPHIITELRGIENVERWFDGIVPFAKFLGVSIEKSVDSKCPGVHKELYDILQSAERQLMKLRTSSKTVEELGSALHVESIGGLRPPKPAVGGTKVSLHCYGLAIDINYRANPYVRRPGSLKVINRATQLLHGVDFDLKNSIKSILPLDSGNVTKSDVENAWEIHNKASLALKEYLQLHSARDSAKDEGRLRSLVERAPSHGKKNPLKYWWTNIKDDFRNIGKLPDFKGHVSPLENGYMNLRKDLVVALVEAGLTWGGMYKSGWDIMHFDLRTGTIKRNIPTRG